MTKASNFRNDPSHQPRLAIATFKPTFAYAAEHNLRLITLNLRGYRGSSPFDANDRAAFTCQNKDDHANALLKQAREIATFLVHIIKTNGLPPPTTNSEGRTTGGLVLLTWSAANALLLSFLANVTLFNAEVRSLLERYLRSAVIFGELRLAYTSVLYSPDTNQTVLHSYMAWLYPRSKTKRPWLRAQRNSSPISCHGSLRTGRP